MGKPGFDAGPLPPPHAMMKARSARPPLSKADAMKWFLFCFAASVCYYPLAAQDMPARTPGHSVHGEAFNEGPRQKARLMGGTGKVSLDVTAKTPEAKAFFEQGLGQLHGFWYFEAERSFRQVALLDPECAMAYWGMTLANANTDSRAKKFIAKAVELKDKVSPREQQYIAALSEFYTSDKPKKERREKYIRALEKLLYEYPSELEAKSLLVLSIWLAREDGVPLTSYLAVDALLSEIFAVEPMHPSHHYRIHLWDHERGEKAIPSAVRSGQSAPSIAHMWHMGGHIFSDLERYPDAVWQQEASSRIDHAYMAHDWILPDQIHNYAHNQEWMIRNLGHMGRVHDAVRLSKDLIEHPRHPKHNTGEDKGSSFQGKRRLMETLERFELWTQLAAMAQSPYIDAPEERLDRAEQFRWFALAAYRQNDLPTGDNWQTKLSEELAACTQAANELKPPQETDAEGPVSAALPANGKNVRERRNLESQQKKLEKFLAELRGVKAFQQNDYATALKELKAGEADKVDPFLLARVQWLAGEKDDAVKKVREALDSRKNQARALALAGEFFWLADKKDDAKVELEKLRALSGEIDLDVPVFARLALIVAELGWPADWRVKTPPAADTGVRPPMESFGPFTWNPPSARNWTALDAQSQMHTSSEFDGKPRIVIFYLGHGCLHCTQQLTAFADRHADFQQQGVHLVGLGTDDPDGLRISIQKYEPKMFPFPLFSDAGSAAFKEFRCYDDFENQPLHGTFFIDAQNRLRWWDISHEPFMNVDFLLKETARLMKFSGT